MRVCEGRDVSLTATPRFWRFSLVSSLPLLSMFGMSVCSDAPAGSPATGHIRSDGFGGKTCASSGIRRQPRSFQPRHADNVQGAREPRAGTRGGPRRAREGRARSQEGNLPALRQPKLQMIRRSAWKRPKRALLRWCILRRGGLLFEPGSRRGKATVLPQRLSPWFSTTSILDGRCHVRPGFGDALFWVLAASDRVSMNTTSGQLTQELRMIVGRLRGRYSNRTALPDRT